VTTLQEATDPDKGRLKQESTPMVLDVPTRSWARSHAEPFYGQEHAAAATLLLDEFVLDRWLADPSGSVGKYTH